jgi:hypothetical protein
MAADEDRALRIRELKASRPDLTWRRIADAVGVSERAAVDWQKTGGIDYENAKALAKVFDADLDWLWRGDRPETPDVMGAMNGDTGQLDEILAAVKNLTSEVAAMGERLTRLEHVVSGLAAEAAAGDAEQASRQIEQQQAQADPQAPKQ